MDLAPDFDEFIGFLTAHGVEFVVVGAECGVDWERLGFPLTRERSERTRPLMRAAG